MHPHLTDIYATTLLPVHADRRQSSAPELSAFVSTPLYEKIKTGKTRAERALGAISEILTLMEQPKVVWQLKGKLARGGFTLMPENDHTPPEMAAKLGYTELEVLRLRLHNLMKHPRAATAKNPDPLNILEVAGDTDLNILYAIRRESAAYLASKPEDATFLELRNLCQLALGNLQQSSFAASRAMH